jgi:hypothetical protein
MNSRAVTIIALVIYALVLALDLLAKPALQFSVGKRL